MLKLIIIKRFAFIFMTIPLITIMLPTHADTGDLDLYEIVRNPVIGNYKGYAEFKMGHYDNAHAIWEALENKGNAQASFNLGILYEDGLGVLQNNQQAIYHYEKAAEAGSGKAQYRLGLLYSAGIKIPKNDEKADKWLAAAAAQGDDDAAALLIQRQLSQQRAELNSQSTEPSTKPPISTFTNRRDKAFFDAENRHAAGQYKEAADIWQQLAEAGDSRSRTRLAWMYEAGQGMTRNLDKAATLYKQSAEEGDAEAQYALAVMLQTGKGQSQDLAAAQEWFQRAATQGYGPAKEALTLENTD